MANYLAIVHRGGYMATKKDTIKCRGEGVPNLLCLKANDNDFFDVFTIWSPNGKSYYCKKCLDKIYNSYFKNNNNSDLVALYYTLMKIDTPLILDVYNKAKNNCDGGKVTIMRYMNEFNKHSNKKEIWKDFSSTNVNLNEQQKESTKQEEEKINKLEEIWGSQDDIKDYDFLESTFERYTNGVEFINSQQEDLYRDLCRDRLLLRKINDNRYDGGENIDKVQTRINKLMSTLKVDQFEVNKPKTLSEQLIFDKIAQIEQTKPADLYKEPRKYEDFNKIKKYYKDLALRPLLNTLCGHKDYNIDIENIEQYDLEDK